MGNANVGYGNANDGHGYVGSILGNANVGNASRMGNGLRLEFHVGLEYEYGYGMGHGRNVGQPLDEPLDGWWNVGMGNETRMGMGSTYHRTSSRR